MDDLKKLEEAERLAGVRYFSNDWRKNYAEDQKLHRDLLRASKAVRSAKRDRLRTGSVNRLHGFSS